MKNIHILPTDKSSRLWKNWESKLILHPTFTDILLNKQHIYITSDEEIKEGDYFFEPINNSILKLEDKADKLIKSIFPTYKKIILTTDQDLIKDGVQEIPDEFLEWFVNNSSCELVMVDKKMSCNYCGEENCDNLRCRGYLDSVWYDIIIPMIQDKEEIKQETLEEAAERFLKNGAKEFKTAKQVLIEFAKWQQEQNKNLYSEEEVEKIAKYSYNEALSSVGFSKIQFGDWFNKLILKRFKK